MARKVKQLRRLKITEGSLVDRPANPLCAVKLYKAEDGGEDDAPLTDAELAAVAKSIAEQVEATMMTTKADIDAAIRDRCTALGQDLMTAWGDEVVQKLYAKYRQAPVEVPVQVEKALPGDALWSRIVKAADGLRRAAETREQAIDRLMTEEDPTGELYTGYLAARGG